MSKSHHKRDSPVSTIRRSFDIRVQLLQDNLLDLRTKVGWMQVDRMRELLHEKHDERTVRDNG